MASHPTTVLRQVIRTVVKDDQPAVTDRELLRRFAADNDQGAFANLVGRHTSMVLGVCRRALPTVQDAEDACQATFLILAQKAQGLRWQASVANWLYTTARRVARNVRVVAQRRARREARAAQPEVVGSVDRMTGRELLATLDDELERLPPRYREPLVLCYLEGLTRDEVAARLGIPVKTLHSRIDRGRKKLHDALTTSGCALGAGLLALAVTSPAGASPPRLVKSILAAASGSVPEAVAELVKGVAVNGVLNKGVVALAAAVVVVTLGVGFGSLKSPAGQPAEKLQPQAVASRQPREKDEKPNDEPKEAAYAGHVEGPDGKPVAGAKLYTLYYTPKVLPIPERGTSDKDGTFRFTVETKDLDRSSSARPWDEVIVVAVAEGHGLGVPSFKPGRKASQTEQVLRLAKDDVPITGRILDLQGQPVAGVSVLVQGLYWPVNGDDLNDWLADLNRRKEGYPTIRQHLAGLSGMWMGRDAGRVVPPAVTDAEGRFRLKGVGRERLVALRIQGPTIATSEFWAMTRPGDKIRVAEWRRDEGIGEMTIVGSAFEHVAAPCQPVVGVVRDKVTGKPIPGAVVESFMVFGSNIGGRAVASTVADKDGRFRLLGMPKGEGNQIRVVPHEDQPYLAAVAPVPDGPGLEPVTVDVGLKRGVWITGKVTDKLTGKPVSAMIRYTTLDNPNVPDAASLGFEGIRARPDDGTFRFIGLPGRGAVTARAWRSGYLTDVGADRIKGLDKVSLTRPFHSIAEVNPKEGDESVSCELVLDPGRARTGKVVGPDGEALTGVRVRGLDELGTWDNQPLKAAEFTVRALRPGESRLLQFSHPEKNLAGSVVIGPDDKEPVTVKLGPAGVLTGRFVTSDGKPLGDLELFALISEPVGNPREQQPQDLTAGSFRGGLRTDKDGKFRVEGLAPGLTYRVALFKGIYLLTPEGDTAKGVTIKAGETKDLGDVQIKLPDE